MDFIQEGFANLETNNFPCELVGLRLRFYNSHF